MTLRKLWRSHRRWGAVLGKLSTRGRGLLHAADLTDSGASTVRVRGPATDPLVFHPDNRVRNVTVRVAHKVPSGFIVC